jgi:hypothetical protein
MRKISAIEIFSKAFYFTFSNFNLILLIFLIHAIANTISTIILHYFNPPYLISYEYTSVTPTFSISKESLLAKIGVGIFLFLTSIFSLIVIFLYIFSKKYKEINIKEIILNTKNYYFGFLILILVLLSPFILPLIPLALMFFIPFMLTPLVSLLILLISFLVFLIISIYINLRLTLSLPIYLEKKKILESLKESWKITRGNVLKLFLIEILISLIVFALYLVFLIFSLPFLLLNKLLANILELFISSFSISILQIMLASSYTFFYFKLKGKK